MRLDQAIAARFAEISRRKARELLAAHRVLVNERPVAIASREVSASDRIAILDALAEIRVLAMTGEIIVVDKPSGMPVQPVRDRSRPSLEEQLRLKLKQERLDSALYLIHRLDTGTSGVVVFARTRERAASLSRLFASGAIRKTYLAVAEGTITNETVIESPIGGKAARTVIRPRVNTSRSTVVEAELRSGRTHQIRIHLASIGHPILGDARYGSAVRADRLFLHAWKLEHQEVGSFTAEPPQEFRQYLEGTKD